MKAFGILLGMLPAMALAGPTATTPGPIGPYLAVCSNPRVVVKYGMLVADCPSGPATAMGWKRCESIVWNEATKGLDCQERFMHPRGSVVPDSMRGKELK